MTPSPLKTLPGSLVFLLILGAAVELRAQLVAWNVNGINASTTNPFSATTLGANMGSGSLTLGSGVTASAAANTFGASNFDTTSLSSAITGGDYISFTAAPGSGFAFSASSLSLTFGVATATSFNVALMSSATGFTAGNQIWSFSFSTASPSTQTVTLSGVSALQNVSASTEFRLYGFRDTSGTTTFRIRDLSGDDISLTGSMSAVPEPSTYALIVGCAALGYAILRRPKRAGGDAETLAS